MTSRAMAILLLLAAAGSVLVAQPGTGEESLVKSDRKTFAVDVLTYPDDSVGFSRVDIYLEVPYNSLQFINQGGFFRASYDLDVTVSDSADRPVTEKTWTGKIEVDSIQEVRLRRPGEIVQKTLLLRPGRYGFNVRVRDVETNHSTSSRLKITVADYAPGKWMVSDAMILRGFEAVGDRKLITPNIGASISDASDSFYVFLKLYNDIGADSGLVFVEVSGPGTIARTDTIPVGLKAGENSLLPRVMCAHLGVGEFTLRVRVLPVPDAAAGGAASTGLAVSTGLAETARSFSMRWIGAPMEVSDIDAAIDQMQYIMEKEALEEMKALAPDAKRERWKAFWAKKDPSPGTDRNELMEEYYSRVAYANQHFSHYTVGWKTDMGMVYIIFGAPNNIERHPFEIDSKPYEVWSYHENARQFVFVDATGFGDYRLQTPIWDVYQSQGR